MKKEQTPVEKPILKYFRIVEKSRLWYFISGTLMLTGLIAILFNGLNLGIDFTGGTNMTFKFQQNVQTHQIRSILKNANLESANIQRIGKDSENVFLIRTREISNEERVKIVDSMIQGLGKMDVLEVDTIGPSIGKELKRQSLWIILSVLILLMLYITFRFEFLSGIAALGAMMHDAIVTVGFVALFHIEVDLAIVVAVLTILGYSIMDTIVIFDRIRENTHIYKKQFSFTELCNFSLTQTMSRSINTALTVLMAILAIIVFGGETIKSFAMILFIGILTGMYSSIFNATPVLVALKKIKI